MNDRPTPEVDPVAAPIVKEIFESSRRGNGLKEICKELNGRGITHKGRRWQKNVVHYLIDQRSLHRHRRLGRQEQGREEPGPGAC